MFNQTSWGPTQTMGTGRGVNPMGPNPMPMRNNNQATGTGGMADISNMNPNVLIARLSQINPGVREVVNTVSGMSPEQAFAHYGYDYNQMREFARTQFGINI